MSIEEQIFEITDGEISGTMHEELTKLISKREIEARINEARIFESHLVSYDQILNEKAILHTIIEYGDDRFAELNIQLTELQEGKNDE